MRNNDLLILFRATFICSPIFKKININKGNFMKYVILASCICLILINTISYSVEIKKFNKYDDNYIFKINGAHCYNFEDTIIFYGQLQHISPDSLYPQFCLFMYHNYEFKRIGIEDIIQDSINSSLYMMGFIRDNENNYWFGFDGGGLYKISKTGITAFDSLLKANSIEQINSLLYDYNGVIWIHSNSNLFRWDGITMEKVIAASKNRYFIPPFIGNGYGLRQIGSKIYFQNMMQTLSYYDMEEKIVDTVSFYPYFKSDEYLIGPRVFINNCFFFMYYLDNVVHFGKFDGDNFTNFDFYLDLINDGEPLSIRTDLAVDKEMNFYFKINSGNGFPKNDSIYIVDENMQKTSLYYKNLGLKNEITITQVFTLSNGDVYMPVDSDGFLIITNPTTVEAPKNWIFMNKLYPNPARDRIRVDFGVEPVNLSSTKLEIYDYLGRLALETNPEVEYNSSTGRGTMTCDISKLHTGFYIAVLTNGKYKRSTPLFVE